MKTAFHKWLTRESQADRVLAARILWNMAREYPAYNNVAWDLLQQTGDEKYTNETFLRAADIALKDEGDDG